MVVTTTGSTVLGLLPGLKLGLDIPNGIAGGSMYAPQRIVVTTGSPQKIVTATTGSQIVYDVTNLEYYMATTANGSTWIHLGSVS